MIPHPWLTPVSPRYAATLTSCVWSVKMDHFVSTIAPFFLRCWQTSCYATWQKKVHMMALQAMGHQ